MGIIYANDASNHNIKKYSFLSNQGEAEVLEVEQSKPVEAKVNPIVQPEVVVNNNDEKVSELLVKIDELSSNVIKLQMQIESKQEEFNVQMQEAKKASFESGKIEGEKEIKALFEASNNELKEKLLKSVETIQEESAKVNTWVEETKKEIPLIAFDIASEVIQKEVSKNSKDIAFSLASSLLEDIKESKEIKIKLNPKDYLYVKEQFSDSTNLTFEKDNAIAKGGVVVLSDYGNLDGNLKIRLLKAKELLES